MHKTLDINFYLSQISEVKENIPPISRDSINEYIDSRPPSRLKQDFNISIKSELLTGIRKEDVASAGSSRGSSANSSSNMSKKFSLNCTHSGHFPKKKPLNPKTDCYYEEELYVKGCTAVWSKGM